MTTPPSTSGRSGLVRALIAAVVVVGVVALATLAVNQDRARALTATFPADHVGPVWLTLSGEPRTNEVEVSWGRLSRTFTHGGPAEQSHNLDRVRRCTAVPARWR